MDVLLAENYPEIAATARKEYLDKISELAVPAANSITSTSYATRADILASVLNSTACSFSTLVFIPLNLHFSLPTNIAASYFFQSPCEVLLSGVMGFAGEQIYRSGLIKDLDITQAQLKLVKNSALAELATSEMDMQVSVAHIINRSIGNKTWTITEWQGAKLSIRYDAAIKYGVDLTDGFDITRDDRQRIITVLLPEPKLLNIVLEPIITDYDDGGIPDLASSDFQLLFEKARSRTVELAEKQGIKLNAQKDAQSVLSYVFTPFTTNGHFPYQIKFVYSKPLTGQI